MAKTKKKEKKELTPYQKFVKANYDKYGGDFSKIGAAWQAKKSGKTTTTSKPKSKKSTPKGVTKTTTKKPAKKTAQKSPKQKIASISVKKSTEMKKAESAYVILEQCRLALGKPKSWKVVSGNKGWTWSCAGFGKAIKRRKLGDLAKAVKDRTKGYV